MRAAVYFTPPPASLLARAAAEWLGRDAFTGEASRPPDAAIDPLVEDPARYGFHATIRAPFRIVDGEDLASVDERLARLCASLRPVRIPALVLEGLGPFFALVPGAPNAGLSDLEALVLDAFEPYRAPLTEAEIARRRPNLLSDRQRQNLERFGYPHVLDDFRFHMTLTGPLDAPTSAAVKAELGRRFAAFDGAPLVVDALALFVEPEPGAAFKVHSLHPFGSD